MAYIEDVRIKGPFSYLAVEEMKIRQRMGAHAYGELKLLLAEEEGANVVEKLDADTRITVKVKEQAIFCGIPLKAKVTTVNQVKTLHLDLVSCSFQLDIAKKNRSFQDAEQTYLELYQSIAAEYRGFVLDHGKGDLKKAASLIQYGETDWVFFKRLAALLRTTVYPDCRFDTPNLYLGIPPGRIYQPATHNYEIRKDLKGYHLSRAAHSDWEEFDELSYQIQSAENFELGDKIEYQGMLMTIFEKNTELADAAVWHTYSFKREQGLALTCCSNPHSQGASINGTVIAVKADLLQVHLAIDPQQEPQTAFWYPFETPYGGGSTTGWYGMPQPGDQVMLYIGGGDERNASVRKAVRADGGQPQLQKPANKCLGTIHGNAMAVTAADITFSENPGSMYLTLHQDQGIGIASSENLSLNTGVMGLECRSIEFISRDRIVAATVGASITVDKSIDLKGL